MLGEGGGERVSKCLSLASLSITASREILHDIIPEHISFRGDDRKSHAVLTLTVVFTYSRNSPVLQKK